MMMPLDTVRQLATETRFASYVKHRNNPIITDWVPINKKKHLEKKTSIHPSIDS